MAVGVPLYFIFMYIKKYFELRSRQKLAVTLTQASINADPQAILEQKASVVDLQGFALPKYKLAVSTCYIASKLLKFVSLSS